MIYLKYSNTNSYISITLDWSSQITRLANSYLSLSLSLACSTVHTKSNNCQQWWLNLNF